MYKLSFHPEVKNDLEQTKWSDPMALARFHAFFTEVKDNPSLLLSCDGIAPHDSNFSKLADIKPWMSMKYSGRKLWRLRFSDFAYRRPDYRIIYFISETLKKITIVAVLKREEINYDDCNHPIYRRISSAYDQHTDK